MGEGMKMKGDEQFFPSVEFRIWATEVPGASGRGRMVCPSWFSPCKLP